MSDVVFARSGYCAALDAWTDGIVWRAHLYVNDIEPDEDTVAADFEEIVMTGYAPLAVEKWTPADLRDDVAWSVADPLIWRFTSGLLPGPVHGYYVTAGPTGPLVWAWRRPGGTFQFGPTNRVLTIIVKSTFPPSADVED